MAEWLNAPVLKTGDVARRSRVRIPPPPLTGRPVPCPPCATDSSAWAELAARAGLEPAGRWAPPPAQQAATGITAIEVLRGPGHWHLVAVGPALTLLTPLGERAPDWAFTVLLGAAGTAHAAGRPLHAGARLAPGPPLDGERSGLVALGLREDPILGAPLLQLVGLSVGEHALMGRVGTALVLEKLAARDSLLRLDPTRA